MSDLTRRSFNRRVAAILGAATLGPTVAREAFAQQPAAASARPRWLLFAKSSGFEHDVIKRRGDEPSFLARALAPVFAGRGVDLVESKDGRLFEPNAINTFTGVVLYTSGNLLQPGTDGQPPMSPRGKALLIESVTEGRLALMGIHCAADTFPTPPGAADPDPYVQMIGGEFAGHGAQGRVMPTVVDKQFVPGDPTGDAPLLEEWYTFKNVSRDVQPIHTIDTRALAEPMYQREPYPITWTRRVGRGNVFYTGLGHREDVVAGKPFATLIDGALARAMASR